MYYVGVTAVGPTMVVSPIACADLPSFVARHRTGDRFQVGAAADPRSAGLLIAVTSAFATALTGAGWTPLAGEHGGKRRFGAGAIEIDIDQAVGDLLSGRIGDAQWRAACEAAGIAQLPVMFPGAAGALLAAPIRDPGAGAGANAAWSLPEAVFPPPRLAVREFGRRDHGARNRRVAIVTVIAAILVVALYLSDAVFNSGRLFSKDGRADRTGTERIREIPPDGRSDLPGGFAIVDYMPAPRQSEVVHDEDAGGGPHDGAYWSVVENTRSGRRFIEIRHLIFVPPLTDAASVDGFIGYRDKENESHAGHPVSYERGKIAGRTAYTWDFVKSDGEWIYVVWIPSRTHSMRLSCGDNRGMNTEFRDRCLSTINTVRFNFRAGGEF